MIKIQRVIALSLNFYHLYYNILPYCCNFFRVLLIYLDLNKLISSSIHFI